MNKSKRLLLKVSWATPIVSAITLPAHAQLSNICTPEQIAGEWFFFVFDAGEIINLIEDGSGYHYDDPEDQIRGWSLLGDRIVVETRRGTIYDGILAANCSEISGINDSFNAEKN